MPEGAWASPFATVLFVLFGHIHRRPLAAFLSLVVSFTLLVGQAHALAAPLPPSPLDSPVPTVPTADLVVLVQAPALMTLEKSADARGPVKAAAAHVPKPVVKPKPAPKPKPVVNPKPVTHHKLVGKASWYCKAGVSACMKGYPAGSMVAAACAPLRAAMGPNWRGRAVTVSANGRSVTVVLRDWCGSTTKTIDLYAAPFSKLAPTSTGVIRDVVIRW